jgi:hypothetical protein
MIEAIFKSLAVLYGLWWFAEVVDLLFRGRTKMPVAVITTEPTRKELKSLPGAYVVIREMTYGEKIYRSGMTGAMKLLKENKQTDYVGEVSMETQRITLWDFANLVMEHNLQDTDGRTLNFKNESDTKKLTAKIGDEVGTYIDEINSFADIDEGN